MRAAMLVLLAVVLLSAFLARVSDENAAADVPGGMRESVPVAAITSAAAPASSEVTLDLYLLPFDAGVSGIDVNVGYDGERLTALACTPTFVGTCDKSAGTGLMRLSTSWQYGLGGHIGRFTFLTGAVAGTTPVTVAVDSCLAMDGEPLECGSYNGEITVLPPDSTVTPTQAPTPTPTPPPAASPTPEPTDTATSTPGPPETPIPTETPGPTEAPSPTGAAGATVKGDASCDGVVDSVDALLAQREAAGLPQQFPDECVQQADVDCDGMVNSLDALWILRFSAGLSVTYPKGCPPIGS